MIFDAYETHSSFLLTGNSLFSFVSQTHGNVKKKKLEWHHQVTIMNHSDSTVSLSIDISSEGIWFPDENEKNDLWISLFITVSLLCVWYIRPIKKKIIPRLKIFSFIMVYSVHYSSNFTFTILSKSLIIWFPGSFSLDTGCVFIHFESSSCWTQNEWNPCCVYTKTGS